MQQTRRRILRGAACVIAAQVASPQLTFAQQFQPSRPIRLIVPYPPAGVVDIVGRQLAKELSSHWKQTVVVDNRAGASGAIGGDSLARAAGDGLTFLVADDGVLVTAPLLKAKMAYNPQTDIVPLGTVCVFPYLIFSGPNSPSLKQLIATAKAKPDTISYATNGIGGPHHLIWERWQEQLGIKLHHVPYGGTTPALQDVAAGRVDVMITTPASAAPLLDAGRVRALAAAGKTRFASLPDVPTAAEQGFALEGDNWIGFMAPASMPSALRESVAGDLRAVLNTAAFKNALTERQNLPLVLTPKETAEKMARERAEAQTLLKRIGVEPT